MDFLKNNTYYKYRNLKDFDRFIEIVANHRLYGAIYNELNDPMEGKFRLKEPDKEMIQQIFDQLKMTRVCSLLTKQDNQEFPDDFLMWSHYADSHKGCCLELKITGRYNSGWELRKVDYKKELPVVEEGSLNDNIKRILSVKDPMWNKEHEVRAIKIYNKNTFKTQSEYYHVVINAIYFGDKVNKDKIDFYKKVVSSIDNSIKLYWIREEKNFTDNFPQLTFKQI